MIIGQWRRCSPFQLSLLILQNNSRICSDIITILSHLFVILRFNVLNFASHRIEGKIEILALLLLLQHPVIKHWHLLADRYSGKSRQRGKSTGGRQLSFSNSAGISWENVEEYRCRSAGQHKKQRPKNICNTVKKHGHRFLVETYTAFIKISWHIKKPLDMSKVYPPHWLSFNKIQYVSLLLLLSFFSRQSSARQSGECTNFRFAPLATCCLLLLLLLLSLLLLHALLFFPPIFRRREMSLIIPSQGAIHPSIHLAAAAAATTTTATA